MTTNPIVVPGVDLETLRTAIKDEYAEVAASPDKGFHFHTGRPLLQRTGYGDDLIEGIPESAIESFAGTGNPFSMGRLAEGEHVVDVGSGAGIDSFSAAKLVGPSGAVVGVDMTPEMLIQSSEAGRDVPQVEFREGHAESLPVEDGWANVIISNGVVNLAPDKMGVFKEMNRVLKPGGRIQIGDIIVNKPVPEASKEDIELWTG